jgi:hypothetical protein
MYMYHGRVYMRLGSGRWVVGKKIRERRLRMNLTIERTQIRTMGWDQVGLLVALVLLLLNHVCPMLVIDNHKSWWS